MDEPLTPAETRILEMICQGKTSMQIADALCRSEYTIDTHVGHILKKLGASGRPHAVAIYLMPERYAAVKPR
jgi:DNA-binding CsgD family transcriptional regulator